MFTPRSYFWDIGVGKRLIAYDPRRLYALVQEADPDGAPPDFNTFDELMQDRMCAEMPEGLCAGDSDIPIKSITKAGVSRFFETLFRVALNKVTGKPTHTSQVEADRRAVICSSCSKNQPISCPGCAGFIVMAQKYLNGRTSIKNDELGGCSLCDCYLRAKIFLPADIIAKLYPGIKFPEKCWVTHVRNDHK